MTDSQNTLDALLELEHAGWKSLSDGIGARRGTAEPFVAAMSSVYTRSNTGWRLALYQQTAITN